MGFPKLEIKKNVLLAPYTSFRIGGPARFFVLAKTPQEVSDAFEWAKEKKMPVLVLGGGTNVLIDDGGWNGLVVRLAISNLKIQKIQDASHQNKFGAGRARYKIQVGSGVNTSALARETSGRGLEGLEWAVGIPGTVGGAVRGNAGAFRHDFSQIIKKARVLRRGKIITLPKEKCGFGYRASFFKNKFKNDVILSVELEMAAGDKKEIRARVKKFLAHRGQSQPKQFSAGCFFKNFQFEDERGLNGGLRGLIPKEFLKHKKIPAGWLIARAGMSGARVGGAQVSTVHCNFIVNLGGATARDALKLKKRIKEKVKKKFGIELEEEVQVVGCPSLERRG